MNKAEKATTALREAAEAYRALPDGLKSRSLLGNQLILDPDRMDDEADRIQARISMLQEAMEK